MEFVLANVLLATLSISSLSIIVVLIFSIKKIQPDSFDGSEISFASGVLLATSFLDLLPEALQELDSSLVFPAVLVGIAAFFLMERFLLWFHHHDDHASHGVRPVAWLVTLGDFIHNFVDGLAIASSFIISPAMGVTTTAAIMAHELPHEMSDYGVLISSGMKKKKAVLVNFLTALGAILGGISGIYFSSAFSQSVPLLLAFSGGMFIYIACSDLIPEMHERFVKGRQWKQTVLFFLGIFLMGMLMRFFEGS